MKESSINMSKKKEKSYPFLSFLSFCLYPFPWRKEFWVQHIIETRNFLGTIKKKNLQRRELYKTLR